MRLIVALAVIAVVTAQAQAAPWFRDVTATHLPPPTSVPQATMDIGALDIDGDGDFDLVLPQEWAANKILINQGGGKFVDRSSALPPPAPSEIAPPGPPAHDSEDVSIADFGKDGRLDLIIVSEDDVRLGRKNVHQYYRGLPGGRFERVLGQVPDTVANALAHADINGDGMPDVLLVGDGQDRLLINDGRGGFRDETEARCPREASVGQDAEFVDIDGDKDLDIVFGLEGGHALWINDGQGRFTDETKTRLPPAGNIEARKVMPFDINNDGAPDLYFAHVSWQGRDGQDRIFINDGRGHFRDETADRIPRENEITTDAKFADLDGDGDADLVQVNFGNPIILANDGKGRFTPVPDAIPTTIEGPGLAAEIADFDKDGHLDLYLGYLSNGAQGEEKARIYDRLFLGVTG